MLQHSHAVPADGEAKEKVRVGKDSEDTALYAGEWDTLLRSRDTKQKQKKNLGGTKCVNIHWHI